MDVSEVGLRLINDEFLRHMLSNISIQEHRAENFLKKLHDEGIRIAMVDAKGVPLRDKNGELRYNTYYGAQTNGSRYALFGEVKKDASHADDRDLKAITVEALEIQQFIKVQVVAYIEKLRLSRDIIEGLEQFNQRLDMITGQSESPYLQALQVIYAFKERQQAEFVCLLDYVENHLMQHFAKVNPDLIGWNKWVSTARVTALEQALNDDFASLMRNKNLLKELQNIQRTKDFILHQIKHKANMSAAEWQAYMHELKVIKSLLNDKKAAIAANPTVMLVDNELLINLEKLKKLIQVGFHVLLHSNKSSDAEKSQFEALNNEITAVLNLPKAMTNKELQSRIKTLAAAKVFLDKWLPEIAKRQAFACEDEVTPLPQKANAMFFREQNERLERVDTVMLVRKDIGLSAN